MRLTPGTSKIDAPGENVRSILPAEFARRKPNRGFEGLSISPDGSRVFAIVQSPLMNPDKFTAENSRNVRLVVLNTTDATAPVVAGMYVYQTEVASDVGAKTQDDLKIGDITCDQHHPHSGWRARQCGWWNPQEGSTRST